MCPPRRRGARPSARAPVPCTIDELGFTPSKAAQTLAGGAVRSVTVLTVGTALYGCAATLRGTEEAARAAGFSVGISVLEPDAARTPQDVAAIVIAHEAAGVRALEAMAADVTVMGVVERPDGGAGIPAGSPTRVWIDDHTAAAHATRYLLGLGLGHQSAHYRARAAASVSHR
ncbi:hypothetical protein ACFYNO_36140 [Kitasatospora sp. NPDC006697]|uniref:hypothetical protein n=1 Tax=Kitasatospora sp. NPDC006697 TaxID=3364020 RepID=UPI0036C70C03